MATTESIKKTIINNTYDSIVQFYWRSDGKFPHWKYMDKDRMRFIASECIQKASSKAMQNKAQLLLEILN